MFNFEFLFSISTLWNEVLDHFFPFLMMYGGIGIVVAFVRLIAFGFFNSSSRNLR